MPTKSTETVINISALRTGTIRLRIIGTTPLYQHRMAAKAKAQLLVGGTKMTTADKAARIKHSPLEEFRDALERIDDGPTTIALNALSVAAAMREAALMTPGLSKTSAKKLLFLPTRLVNLYGVPKLKMDVVRMSDISRTPDIRTRPYFESWGAEVEIKHILPQLPVSSVVALAVNAGVLCGLGDWRQERGGWSGAFRVTSTDVDDEEWDSLVLLGGREAQLKAIESPEFADDETAWLMEQFFAEEARRRELGSAKPRRKSKPAADEVIDVPALPVAAE